MAKVLAPPAGLLADQRRPRQSRLVERADWYLAVPGTLQLVGSGDLSLSDLESVRSELSHRYGELACFVAVGRPRELEEHLPNRFGTRRITWSERIGRPISPSLRAIARGARLAALSSAVCWVDSERLFAEGEEVPLPWTSPPVALQVVRPARLRRALTAAVGPGGPRRALLA